jgi:two-component system sensor histidine kinase AtoS
MMEQLVPILLPAAVVVLGLVVTLAMVRKYRRELGLRPGEADKTPDVSFIINAFQDVTRQLKEKEKELERLKSLAEQRAAAVESSTENILECVSNGVITFDGDGRVTTINRAAEEMLGLTRDAAVGRSCRDIIPSDELCILIAETLENQVPSRRMEVEIAGSRGRTWLGFNTALLKDRQGVGLGAILSFSDLTEVKRLQEQIELKERLTALGEMSAGIAHELRNPMAVIAGYLNLLAKKQDEPGQRVIRDIRAEIEGMNRIIGDLLTFARPTSLNRVGVKVRELLESCLESALQSRPNTAVRTSIDLEDIAVPADEVLMRQALTNVLVNALEAMPSGGLLTVEARGNRDLTIIVRDTGHGVPHEDLKRIFLPFFTTKEEGVGMGLALAHKVITAHGGRIEAESEGGKGTAFIMTLPLR